MATKPRKGEEKRRGKEATRGDVEGSIRDLSRHKGCFVGVSKRQVALGIEDRRVRVRPVASVVGTKARRRALLALDGPEGDEERAVLAVREWVDGRLDAAPGDEKRGVLRGGQYHYLAQCRNGRGSKVAGSVGV